MLVNDVPSIDRPADEPPTPCREADLLLEIRQLREGLWDCYAIAGGDPASLVVDCVRDLRGFFDAARRDLR